jgi:hypothetical protein
VSATLALSVPAPTLAFTGLPGGFAPLEDIVTVRFDAVQFPDGSTLGPNDFKAGYALVTRVFSAGAMPEYWDASAATWRSVAVVADPGQLQGVPLLPPKSGGAPWEGLVIATGQKDAAGAPQYTPATAHYPQYRWRGLFRAQHDGADAYGLGPESPAVEFASMASAQRFGVDLSPAAPNDTTVVRLALRDAAHQVAGSIVIDASSGNAVVTIGNFDTGGSSLATLVLQSDGSIVLTPAAGKGVVIAGDVETERITYRPAAGGAKVVLP